jgi:ribose/xylose/arabinose/galactoside ABC-type transport system permease subunit
MEKQKLPNGVLIIVLGIFGFICCCLSIGFIPSGIGYYLALKSEKIYKENPELYENYGQIKTGKIISLIALIISVLSLIWTIYSINKMGGWDAYMEQVKEMTEQFQQAQ